MNGSIVTLFLPILIPLVCSMNIHIIFFAVHSLNSTYFFPDTGDSTYSSQMTVVHTFMSIFNVCWYYKFTVYICIVRKHILSGNKAFRIVSIILVICRFLTSILSKPFLCTKKLLQRSTKKLSIFNCRTHY